LWIGVDEVAHFSDNAKVRNNDSRWLRIKCEIFRIKLSHFIHAHFRAFALSHFITSLNRLFWEFSQKEKPVALIIILSIELGLSVFFVNKKRQNIALLCRIMLSAYRPFFFQKENTCRLNNNCDNRIWPQRLFGSRT